MITNPLHRLPMGCATLNAISSKSTGLGDSVGEHASVLKTRKLYRKAASYAQQLSKKRDSYVTRTTNTTICQAQQDPGATDAMHLFIQQQQIFGHG
jgi:hypothetical protein